MINSECLGSVCDWIENSDRTGTGLDRDHFNRNRITSLKKLTKFDRIG